MRYLSAVVCAVLLALLTISVTAPKVGDIDGGKMRDVRGEAKWRANR